MNSKQTLKEMIKLDITEGLFKSAHKRLVEYTTHYGMDKWFRNTLDEYVEMKEKGK